MARKKYEKPTAEIQVVNEETIAPAIVETQEAPEVTEPSKNIKGVVVKCKKLNIRNNPEGKVLYVVDANDELEINLSESVNGWYAVITTDGKIGYCMKKYVRIVR